MVLLSRLKALNFPPLFPNTTRVHYVRRHSRLLLYHNCICSECSILRTYIVPVDETYSFYHGFREKTYLNFFFIKTSHITLLFVPLFAFSRQMFDRKKCIIILAIFVLLLNSG